VESNLLFEFSAKPENSKEAFVGAVPSNLSTAQDLLASLYEGLHLPGYFGFNWDALSDCLRDLHWVSRYEVIIWHEHLPVIAESEPKTYLDVLLDSVQSWRTSDEHRLRVVFPEDCKERVVEILASSGASSVLL
jgi:hypothetical protein